MNIEVESWGLERAAELTELYNSATEPLVYTYPISPEKMSDGATRPVAGLTDETFLVGRRNRTISSFMHLGLLSRADKNEATVGVVRMLVTTPRDLRTGSAVIEAALEWFASRGLNEVLAFDKASYHFYRYTTPFLTDAWPHTWSLLVAHGFRSIDHGQFFHWRDFSAEKPAAPDPNIELRYNEIEGKGCLPNLTLEALRDEEPISRVLLTSLDHFSESPEAANVCYVDGFGTTESERRKGIGQFVMLSAMHRMRQYGYQHIVLDAVTSNTAAQLLYLGMGFTKQHNTYRMVKRLA